MDKNLSSALLKAQSKMGKLIKDSENVHFRNKYASLTAVLDTVREPLTEAGLVLYQSATAADGMVMVRSALIHAETGESIEEMLPLPVAQQTPQAYGSAITYGRRYLAMAMCGLSPDDDDGEAGSQPKAQAPKTQPQHRAARPPAPRPNPVPEDENFYPEDDHPFADVPNHKAKDEAIATSAASLYSSDRPMTELASRLTAKCIELHGTSGSKKLSTTNKDGTGAGQYGLLAGKLDHLTGQKGSHNAMLSALTGENISKENPPGWKVKEIIDWLNDEAKRPSTEQALRDVWAALQAVA